MPRFNRGSISELYPPAGGHLHEEIRLRRLRELAGRADERFPKQFAHLERQRHDVVVVWRDGEIIAAFKPVRKRVL